jgi:uncharacterized membrane protein
MQEYVSKPERPSAAPKMADLFQSSPVRVVAPSAIQRWLRQGWADLKVNPLASLVYGLVFAVVGMVISYVSSGNLAFFIATTTGFLLMGPFLALGLYDLSRQIEQDGNARLIPSALSMTRNSVGLILYAAALGLGMVFWIRMSAIITAIFFNQTTLVQEGYIGLVNGLLNMEHGWVFALILVSVGALFALFGFVTGIVTVPMLLDRKADIVTAASTSIRVVYHNPLTSLLWGATITAIIGLGMLSFYVGLIVAMPWVAHASWHAYRDMVQDGGHPNRLIRAV